MGTNTFKLDNGNLSAVVYVKASASYRCQCGNEFSVELDWPEDLTQTGAIAINGICCPRCSTSVALPRARYWVEDYVLRSEPIPE